MKVLQLIDSLQAGGAEHMAVNYANALESRVEGSYLCATRAEGLLRQHVSNGVQYVFLHKQSTFDFKAIQTLSRIVQDQGLDVLHAHASSYFLATIVKILNPKLTLVWHDHYGASEFLDERPKRVLKICSKFFNHIITVNTKLETWSKVVLKMKTVTYLPNYAVLNAAQSITKLKGVEGKRIVCLANLRSQKDHLNLLKAFNMVRKEYADWSLHLVGQDCQDTYSESIKTFINVKGLENHVFIYGSCPDIHHVLNQCSIGVLSSRSEGLPLALLEYGLAGLPVIVTNVGDCDQVVSNDNEGQLIPPSDADALASALSRFIKDKTLRLQTGQQLNSKIKTSFSESVVIDRLLEIYKHHQK